MLFEALLNLFFRIVNIYFPLELNKIYFLIKFRLNLIEFL